MSKHNLFPKVDRRYAVAVILPMNFQVWPKLSALVDYLVDLGTVNRQFTISYF